MQVYPHAIEADTFGPTQFPVNGFGIKGFFLPEFQLIDGCAWIKIGASQPGLVLCPGLCLFLGPSFMFAGFSVLAA
jgi:hypothetical protein